MKNIIIGTAGHIDHGKTALVKALTGIETDTLKEEKKRGITINNGYAYLKLNNEVLVGIIDVPGHEKLIKNMISGISSIDLVLFIIASDEGIMPQTKEHMEVLNILNIKNAIIVMTKCDLVDEEWREFVKSEIREFTQNTNLENAPIISVSSKDGTNIEELKNEINRQIEAIETKDKGEIFRLPIDRVFNVNGFGTIITGSALGGIVRVSDELEIITNKNDNINVRVRGIEVHGISKKQAGAGERIALNIVYDDKQTIKKGMIVSEKGKQESSYMIDMKLNIINSYEKSLLNRERVRIYHYSKEVMGRVVILNKEELKSGEDGLVQLRLEEKISTKMGDKLVIRTYSPMKTIGGGIVLNQTPKKAKRFNEDYINSLKIRESSDIKYKVENILIEKSKEFITIDEIASMFDVNINEIEAIINYLLENKKIIKVSDNIVIHNKYLLLLEENIYKIFKDFYEKNNFKLGISKDSLKNKLIKEKIKNNIFDIILNIFIEREVIEITNNIVVLKGYKINLTKEQKLIKKFILEQYEFYKFEAPRFEEIIKDKNNKKEYKNILSMLIEEKLLIFLDNDLYILGEYYKQMKEKVIDYINMYGLINLSDLKIMINTSRRYLVALLEKLDNDKITKRVDDGRVLY